MRDLKFRAWDNRNSKMISNALDYELLRLNSEQTVFVDDKDELHIGFTKCDYEHFEIMQFIGLTDKNGVEIYEGDLIRWGNSSEKSHLVVFGYHCIGKDDWGVEHKTPGFCIEFNDGSGYCGIHEDYEVIGNRFTHPHLLTP